MDSNTLKTEQTGDAAMAGMRVSPSAAFVRGKTLQMMIRSLVSVQIRATLSAHSLLSSIMYC